MPQPFWFDQALQQEAPASSVIPLTTSIFADVCIIGGGYTGLWSAIKLKLAEPSLNVVVVEAGLCGSGASGRNGGCLLTWSTKYPSLMRLFGEQEAARLVQASENAVSEIAAFCKQHQIACELQVDGAYYTASNPAQLGMLDSAIHQLKGKNLNSWQAVTREQLKHTGSLQHLQGWFSAKAGSVQPGLLVRGLKQTAEKLGVVIYEHTPMQTLECSQPAVVRCAQGQVRAKQVILATNAWMPRQFGEFSRTVALVSSDMLITRPAPAVLERIGLTSGAAVADSRTFVHYYRRTPDGRLMLGKGGNLFAYANRMLPAFNEPSRYQPLLERALTTFFPDFSWQDVERTWTGASDRSVSGFPFFGYFRGHKHIVYGTGYSGNGVVQSYLGGEILRDLLRAPNSDWAQSGLAQGPLGYFPPEPIRWCGAMMVRNAIRRKENAEDQQQKPRWWDCQLAKLAASAGKADH